MSHEIKLESHKKITVSNVESIEEMNKEMVKIRLHNNDFNVLYIRGFGLRLEDFDSENKTVFVSGSIVSVEHDTEK